MFLTYDQEGFFLLTVMNIHLPMHQPEIMKITFVLVVSYLETTEFSDTLCLVIQAWTACSCSVLSSSSQKIWPSKRQHVLLLTQHLFAMHESQ